MKSKVNFTLYWVSDGISEDWFVLVPCHINDPHSGSYMAEWFHCEYEGLTDVGSVQDSTICYEARADDVLEVPLNKIPNHMREGMKKNYRGLKGNLKGLKELFFDPEFNAVGIFKQDVRDMFEKELGNDFDKIMDWCWTNLEPDENGYDDPEFDGKYFVDAVDEYDANGVYKIMIDWSTIQDIIQYGKSGKSGYAPIHGQIELLENLGFTIIDDGDKSGQRVVIYDGTMYSEGEMESKVQEGRRIMNIIHGQKPDLN